MLQVLQKARYTECTASFGFARCGRLLNVAVWHDVDCVDILGTQIPCDG